MAGVFVVAYADIAVTAAQDLVSGLPASGHPCQIISCEVSQSTDFGDAQAEGLTLKAIRGHTTLTGGTSITARPVNAGNTVASTASWTRQNTTIASSGTTHDMYAKVWNVQQEWAWRPVPEEFPDWANAEYLVIRLMEPPADSIDVTVTLTYREIY